MGTAINPPDSAPAPSPVTRRRGRLQLVLILLLTVGPMVLATGMYKLKFWLPESRSYHGELLGNGQSRAALGVTADEQRWQLLVTAPQACAADCQQLVYLARQLQIGLGRDASRASHALAAPQPVDAATPRHCSSNTRNCSATPWTCRLIHRAPRATVRRNCGSSTPTAIWCCATAPG